MSSDALKHVSVAMASYNGGQYIREQISSILSQLGPQDELVISDDGSTDGTWQLISTWPDARIRALQNPNRGGIAKNFENALQHCTGAYIFLADQDDIWLPQKVEKSQQALQNNLCVLHNATLIDAEGKALPQDLFSIYNTRVGFFKNFVRNTFVGCCMAFRQELLKSVLPIPRDVTLHDMWIALHANLEGEVALIQEPLMLYRRHDANASTTSAPSNKSRREQVKYRLQMLREIIKIKLNS